MMYKIFMLPILMLAMSIVSIGSAMEETAVDVKFEVLTGLGIQDYYSGDHFWYNITMKNSGTTNINATFTVTVRNTTGDVFGAVGRYRKYLEPNQTTFLYPNYTRLGKEEVSIYFMDAAGTYTLELTSDVPMLFYRYYETGRYTVEQNRGHMNIDAMPSYQRLQNEKLNQYLQESQSYMNKVQEYIEQSRLETNKTRALAFSSVAVALISVVLSVISLPKTRGQQFRVLIVYVMLVAIMIIIYILLFGI